MKLREAMHKGVYTIEGASTVREAARIMNAKGIGSIVATVKKRPVGILTERDILRLVAQGKPLSRLRVATVMTKPIIVGQAEAELKDAIRLMVEHRIKKLPIVDGSRMVGIVTLTDFARLEPGVHEVLSRELQDARRKIRRRFDKYLADRPLPFEIYA